MIRASLLVWIVCAACAAEPAPWGEGTSCEVTRLGNPSLPPPPVDLVLVVSDATTMAPYADRLVTGLRTSMEWMERTGLPSLRVVVVDASGRFSASPRVPGCTPPPDPYVADLGLHGWQCSTEQAECRVPNYEGTLADAVACIGAVAPKGAPSPPLLDRLAQALDADPDVIRPDSTVMLAVVTAEDDASEIDPADLLARLRAGRPEVAEPLVSVIGPANAPRLAALRAAADPYHATFTAIDSPEWAEALVVPRPAAPLGIACLPAAPTECVAHEGSSAWDSGAAIPPCVMAAPDRPDPSTPLPCFWIEEDPIGDPAECPFAAWIERATWAPDALGVIRCACDE